MKEEPSISDENTDEPKWKRGFWSLFLVQIQGAFSDSVFKLLVLFLVSTSITNEVLELRKDGTASQTVVGENVNNDSVVAEDDSSELTKSERAEVKKRRDPIIFLIMVLFALPMILFVMTAGFLSDKYSKSKQVTITKIAEIGIMALAAVFLYTQNLTGLFIVLFLMATQSSFFSPAKLGMLPEMLPGRHLSWGNGIMAMGSFVSIIAGGILAGVLSESLGPEKAWIAGVGLVVLACLGTFFCTGLPKSNRVNPDKVYQPNFLAEIWTSIKLANKDRILILAIAGSTYFWFLAALLGEPTVILYGQDLLELDDEEIGILRAFLAIGIAFGSVMAGFMSRGKIEYGLIPAGAIGLSTTGLLMSIEGLSFAQVGVLLFLLGTSGGFFVVPINSLVQFRPDKSVKGMIIATERWLTSAGVFLAAVVFGLLTSVLQLTPTQIFLLGGLVTIGVTIYAIKLMPDALTRLALWLLTNTIYRLNVRGSANIPDKGGALLVANHMSFADALFIIASTHRHVRFVMHQKMYRRWWIYPFARMLRCIPVASEMNPRELVKSLNEATDAIKQGQVVCVFAEGQIGHFGQVLPFRRGLNKILKGVDAPIIPVHLDNVWGSIFSFARGKFYFKLPRSIPYPITVSYGNELPANTPAHFVRKAVIDLSVDAWVDRKSRIPTLQKALIRTSRKFRNQVALSDETGTIKYLKALSKSILYCKMLKNIWKDDERIALFLPNSIQGTLINWSAILSGKVPVNIHDSFENDAIKDILARCEIKTIITNQEYAAKLEGLEGFDVHVVKDEEAKIGFFEKLKIWFLARFCPHRILERSLNTDGRNASLDDLATICMSRGRSGRHKCVRLSHYNFVSNCLQINQVFDFDRDDSMLGVIHYSHALGFATSVVFPAVLGMQTHYCESAEDARTIGRLLHEKDISVMFTSPRLMKFYLKGCEERQFGSLRTVLVGGEKLSPELGDEFEDQFGIRPLEAYGCVECSPVVSVNTTDFRKAGIRQVGSKKGSVGLLIPGMTYKIVDPDTKKELGFNEYGSLLVKGPNVMSGYVEKESEPAFAEGEWFETTDFASVDENGFVTVSEENPN